MNRIYLVSICVHISSPFVKVPLQDLKPDNFLLATDETWPCESRWLVFWWPPNETTIPGHPLFQSHMESARMSLEDIGHGVFLREVFMS